MSATPSPAKIFELARGFMAAKVLLVATRLHLFDALAAGPLRGDEIAERLGLHPRAIPDFTDALVALGMLERHGDGPGARYANRPETARYLVRASDDYVGGLLEMYEARLYRYWTDLEEALRTGKPQNELKHTGSSMFEELYREPARLEQFMGAMSGISRNNFVALAERFDFSPYRTLCDVGGAAATLSCAVAARHPHLRCTSFDLPVVEPIARAAIARRGLEGRIGTASGDFFRDPLPRADVITMGMILHDWNLEKKRFLIRAAYDALPDGGVFIAVENMIDDARREHVFGLLMSLNMLIEFGDAFDFTGADFRGWCTEAGFRRVEVLPLGGPASAGIAFK
ncbi:MAG: methyltransferase [Thermodesulfobacteriota bacterium]